MMKHPFLAFAIGILIALCVSCKGQKMGVTENAEASIERFFEADSAKYAHLDLEIELPVASNEVRTAIRQQLVKLLAERLPKVTSYEGENFFAPYDGDATDGKALTGYYRQQLIALLDSLSMDDALERIKYIDEAEELSEEEKARQKSEIPGFEYSYKLKQLADTLGYVVYLSQDYIYMGGAHGGIGGDGCLTFNRETGLLVEQMIDPACVEQIQSLLIEGLLSYYNDNGVQLSETDMRSQLQIEGDIIPLPVQQPYPTKEGLVFTYNQYEIASYADGMPSFVIPFSKIAPYMTEQGKKVCGL